MPRGQIPRGRAAVPRVGRGRCRGSSGSEQTGEQQEAEEVVADQDASLVAVGVGEFQSLLSLSQSTHRLTVSVSHSVHLLARLHFILFCLLHVFEINK